jgi:hypothetical protein
VGCPNAVDIIGLIGRFERTPDLTHDLARPAGPGDSEMLLALIIVAAAVVAIIAHARCSFILCVRDADD